MDEHQQTLLRARPRSVAQIFRDAFEADDCVRPMDVMGTISGETGLATLASEVLRLLRDIRALAYPLGRDLQAVSALLEVRQDRLAAGVSINIDYIESKICFMCLPTGSEKEDMAGLVVIPSQDILSEQAAADGRLAAHGTYFFVEQTTLENGLTLNIVLIVCKFRSTGRAQCCGRAVLSRSALESRRVMFRKTFGML